MELFIIKRDGKKEIFSVDKIKNAIAKAFLSVGSFATQDVLCNILCRVSIREGISVEEIQNQVEVALMAEKYYAVAKAYMLYRQKHAEDREVTEKLKFLMDYCDASNAATGSKFDSNANVENKNMATLIGELPKSNFIRLNRRLLIDRIKDMYGKELADKYIELLGNHFIYKNDNPDYERFVQQVFGLIETYNKKYRTSEAMFNCEMIPAENVGVKHAKWDREAGYKVYRDCYNSYFYKVEDNSLNIIDKFRMHGRKYIEHLTGGSALHLNLAEHLGKEQYSQLLKVAAQEGCNYFTFNIPNTVCNVCGHIDKRMIKECPNCKSTNLDYLTRIIGYMKRVSNFSQTRQKEASKRHYAEVH